ncbi:hypothetical protein Tco_0714805 [Tanacetum coccineum]
MPYHVKSTSGYSCVKPAKEIWHILIVTHQGNSQVKNCKIDLLTQEYEKFSISNEEAIDSGFRRFNAIVTSLKSLDPDYSSKNHVRKFLHALPLKWRDKVMAIEESKDLAILPLDELVRNLKFYEMILESDSVVSKTTTKDKVKSLALKAKVTMEQTIDDSDSQDGSDEDINEVEAKAFNLMARNFRGVIRSVLGIVGINHCNLDILLPTRFGLRKRFHNSSNEVTRTMNPSAANKIALDNALVASEARGVSPKEPNKKPAKGKKDVSQTRKPATKPKLTKNKASVKDDRGKGFLIATTQDLCTMKNCGEEDDDEDDSEDESDDDNNDNDGDYNDNEDKNDDDDEVDSDRTESDIIHTPEDYELTDEEDNADNVKEKNKEEKDELRIINIILLTEADQSGADQQNVSQESGFEQEEEDAHVTLTTVHDTQKTKVTVIPEITSAFTTTIPPPPPSFNPLPQHATPTPTPTTSEITTSFPSLPDFSSVFKFNDRVTNLEKDLSEMNQVDRQEYIDVIDTSVRTVIEAEVKTQLPQILPQVVSEFATPVIERNITESLEAVVLAKSSSQPNSTYEAAASLSKFELIKILMDKMEEHKSYLRTDYKRKLYDALVKSYNTKKHLFETYSEVFTLKRNRDDKDKDQEPSVGSDRGTKRRKSSKDVELSRDPKSKESKSTSSSKGTSHLQHKLSGKSSRSSSYPLGLLYQQQPGISKRTLTKDVYSRKRIIAVTSLKIMKWYDYGHLDKIEVRREDRELYKLKEGNFLQLHLQDNEDILLLLVQQKLTNLTIDEHYDLNAALHIFRPDLRNRYTYTAYSDPGGVIYDDQNNKNRLMCTDELHKFSDGILNSVRYADDIK